jgi:RND family efflux transporter MFP subunit
MTRRRAQSTAKWILSAALITAAVVLGGYVALRFLRPVVTVTEPVEGPVVQAFYSTGTVSPEREFPIKANVAGVITEMRVDKGDRVKKGQVLAVVVDPPLQFSVDKAKAELNEKRQLADEKTSPPLMEIDAKLKGNDALTGIANREYDRLTRLVTEGSAATQTDLDRAMDRVKTLWSENESLKAQRAAKRLELQRMVDVAQAALASAQAELDKQQVRSPIDGAVLDRPISLGTRLAVNDHIMQIADVSPDNLLMRAAVDEEDINKVRVDQPVKMTLYSFAGEIFDGTVEKIYDKADPDRRTFEVDVKVDKRDERFAAGMTGELAFIMASKERATVVPSQALQNGMIWIARDGRLTRTDAKIGLKSVERVEIVSGINPGERVVISPVQGMAEGQTVRTSFMDPTAAAALNKVAVSTESFKGFR